MIDFIKKHKFILFLFLLSFILRLIYVLVVKTPIISDFKTMYDASIELLNGTHNYNKTNYFLLWGYQTGHSFYQYILLKIINNVIFLKIINCIITSFIPVFIYLIAKKFASIKASKIMSIIYALFPFPLFLNSVLTNQHLPLLLILISVYLLLNIDFKNKYIFKSILVGFLLGISNILRSEVIVILFSIFIFLIFMIKKVGFKKIFVCFISISSIYLCVTRGTSYIFKETNISTNGLNNMNPYWKFVCGLNYESNGMYTETDAIIYSGNKKLAKEETINRAKKISKLPLLFAKKTKILLINSDLSWSVGHVKNNNIKNIFNIINQIFIYIFILLSLISLPRLLKLDNTYLLCFLIVLTYIGIYMLIEVMPRYAYSIQPFIAILGTYGLDDIFNRFKKRN